MFCTHCGHSLPNDANFCAACGTKMLRPSPAARPPEDVQPPEPPPQLLDEWPPVIREPVRPARTPVPVWTPKPATVQPAGGAEPAGLGARISAALLDAGVWIAVVIVAGAVLAPGSERESVEALAMFGVATPVWWWIYSAGYISSAKQATPGMAMAGIAVTDLIGERVSFWRASARFVVKLATVLAFPTLIASMVTILRSSKGQAVHDLASGSLVLEVARPPAAAGSAARARGGHLSVLDAGISEPDAEAFPLGRAAIWLLCVFATPIVGAILYYVWRGSHPAAARYANMASFVVFGIWVLFWLASLFATLGGLI